METRVEGPEAQSARDREAAAVESCEFLCHAMEHRGRVFGDHRDPGLAEGDTVGDRQAVEPA